jgi:dTDP-4-dehydrorhamnose 3,5-epimerase
MVIQATLLPDVFLLEVPVYEDYRGFFMEAYQAAKLAELGISERFVQDNQSGSKQGVLRGLHYQIQQPQGKLVRAIVGTIFDVAVDLRRSSPTFGKWVAHQLSAENRLQLWVPPGFAHGFYVLSEQAEVLYKTTDYYAPQFERTLLWNDPDVGIEWPISPHHLPFLSPKDAQGKLLSEAEVFD